MRPYVFSRLLKRVAVLAELLQVLFSNSAVAARTTPKYVQGSGAVPQFSQTSFTVTYTAALAAVQTLTGGGVSRFALRPLTVPDCDFAEDILTMPSFLQHYCASHAG